MVIEIAEVEVKPGQEQAYEATMDEVGRILADAGCISHSVARGIEDPSKYLVRTEWKTLEDHTEGFIGSPGFERLLELVGPLAAGPPQISHYQPIDD